MSNTTSFTFTVTIENDPAGSGTRRLEMFRDLLLILELERDALGQ